MPLSRQAKIGLYIGSVTLFVSISVYLYQICFSPNIQVGARQPRMLYIPTGAGFEQVLDTLRRGDYLSDIVSFAALARASGYRDGVKPGAYLVHPDVSNLALIRILKNGAQTPVRITFNNVRLKSELAAKLAARLELDSATILARLGDADTCRAYGFAPETITCMFIPNTYEVYWTLSATALWKRMKKEYDKFWTPDRLAKAAALKMSPDQVITLASIVEAETKRLDEMPIVAGVYLNRLDTGMKLQADPTVVYAVGDFSLRRIREGHKAKLSPYNTYQVEGLPPGPISLPSTTAIDAVLMPRRHNYYFFVAKRGYTGYHVFAEDYARHLQNARRYQAWLDSLSL